VVTVQHRLVALTKTLVLAAGALTALAIVVVSSLALATWNYVPVSWLLETSGISERYAPASESPRLGTPNIVGMFLELPAVLPLIAALAFLTLFYVWLSSLAEDAG
jgi:hypothetical protein